MSEPLVRGRSAAEIAESIKEAVRKGQLRPGMSLPPIRRLAAEIGVNRNTVAAAYGYLADAGIVHARGRGGTIVVPFSRSAPPKGVIPPGVRNLTDGNPDPALLPDIRAFVDRIPLGPRLYGNTTISEELSETAFRWFAADGIDEGHMAVTGGALDAIERILSACLMPGDLVAVEEPCFHRTLYLLHALGLEPVAVPVDAEGMHPEALEEALGRRVRALVATPRAHNPTGATVTSTRSGELRAVLDHFPDLLIVEDDYFAPIALDPPQWIGGPSRRRWAIIRSVSKCFGPDLRLAIVVGDRETIGVLEQRMRVGQRWVSHILQDLVAKMLADRSTVRAMRVAADTYARRRKTLIEALGRNGFAAQGYDGLNVWMRIPHDEQLAQALLYRGWAVKSATSFFSQRRTSALRISIGLLPEDDIPTFLGDLLECYSVGPMSPTGPRADGRHPIASFVSESDSLNMRTNLTKQLKGQS